MKDSETNRKNITTKQETIRPIGLALQTPLIEDEDHIIGFDGDYKFEKTSGDVLVSRYHNDNIFQDSKKICESFGLTAQHARYRGAQELNSLVENYECFMIFPDAYSKLTAFELMQLKMPVILPSESLLLKMSMAPTTSLVRELLLKQLDTVNGITNTSNSLLYIMRKWKELVMLFRWSKITKNRFVI